MNNFTFSLRAKLEWVIQDTKRCMRLNVVNMPISEIALTKKYLLSEIKRF